MCNNFHNTNTCHVLFIKYFDCFQRPSTLLAADVRGSQRAFQQAVNWDARHIIHIPKLLGSIYIRLTLPIPRQPTICITLYLSGLGSLNKANSVFLLKFVFPEQIKLFFFSYFGYHLLRRCSQGIWRRELVADGLQPIFSNALLQYDSYLPNC